jgi:hypothetical protein
MNLEEKTRLFGHFLFCEVKAGKVTITMQAIDGNTGCVIGSGGLIQLPIEDCKLVLKELKTITRRDAMQCAALANLPAALYKNWQVHINTWGQAVFSLPDEDPNYRHMIIFEESKLNWSQMDFLRNSGYNIGVPENMYIIENKL